MISADITILRRALVESVLEEYKEIPAEEEIQYAFSPAFSTRIEKLIRKSNTRTWYYINSPLKKAIIIAILIGLLTITAAAVPAIREALIDFFVVEREEGVYGITFDPEQAATAPHQIETYYGPTNIPQEFMQIADEKTEAAVILIWMNDKSELISYNQHFIPRNATYTDWIGINSENTTRESQIINGYLVEIIHSNEYSTYVWTDNTYIYYVEMTSTIPFDVFKTLITSMTVLEK